MTLETPFRTCNVKHLFTRVSATSRYHSSDYHEACEPCDVQLRKGRRLIGRVVNRVWSSAGPQPRSGLTPFFFFPRRYHELDLRKSLRENLMFKTVVEYPELHVVLKVHHEEYRTRVPGKAQTRSFIPALLIQPSPKHSCCSQETNPGTAEGLKCVIVQTHTSC